MDPDFEELSNDVDLIARFKKVRAATDNIEKMLKPLMDNPKLYDSLSDSEKISHDLLLSFGMNALYWMYLRLEGVDPTNHKIKAENERLKKSMARAQEIKDRKTIMPRIDKAAAQRFVKSGLWTPKNNKDNSEQRQDNSVEMEEDWDETPVTLNEQVDDVQQTNDPDEPSVS